MIYEFIIEVSGQLYLNVSGVNSRDSSTNFECKIYRDKFQLIPNRFFRVRTVEVNTYEILKMSEVL
jgi:hypothetical protein